MIKPKMFGVHGLKPVPTAELKQPKQSTEPPTPQNIRLHAEVKEVETEHPGGAITKPYTVITFAGEVKVIFTIHGKEREGIPFTCIALSEESCTSMVASFIRKGS